MNVYRHPIDYHRHNANKKTRHAMIKAYISKVAIAACLFCMPKFFESKIAPKTEEREIQDPITNLTKTVKTFDTSSVLFSVSILIILFFNY